MEKENRELSRGIIPKEKNILSLRNRDVARKMETEKTGDSCNV